MSSSLDPLRVLLFGDSLTAGFHSWGLEYHPYSRRLETRLSEHFPSKGISLTVNGLPGDTVINGSFHSRLESQLKAEKYDWIVLLGGTNDIGWGRDVDDIFGSLKQLWNTAILSGASVLALTVAANQSCQSRRGRMRIEELNDQILSHHQDLFFTLDLYSMIPWPQDDLEAQQRIWDDGLHFSPDGYDMIGDAVADKLISMLSNDPTIHCQSSSTVQVND